jgi:pimeloyl-ACP methyl ester carboxylesterase
VTTSEPIKAESLELMKAPVRIPPREPSSVAESELVRPEWFDAALADKPERRLVPTQRGRIEMLTWGEVGKPGLLLVHGNGAHADWWSFIAPYFSSRYRVVAMSLPGMGESDWREQYPEDDFLLDAQDVATMGGMYEAPAKPVYIGHSFGGRLVLRAATRSPGQLSGAVLIDTMGDKSDEQIQRARSEMIERQRSSGTSKHHRIHHDLAAAISRFKLMPPQPVHNLFILDHIARTSLREVAGSDERDDGWIWKFDPENLVKHRRWTLTPGEEIDPILPFAHIVGEESSVFLRDENGNPKRIAPQEIQAVIPGAAHHILIDQPLALVGSIRTILSAWRFG